MQNLTIIHFILMLSLSQSCPLSYLYCSLHQENETHFLPSRKQHRLFYEAKASLPFGFWQNAAIPWVLVLCIYALRFRSIASMSSGFQENASMSLGFRSIVSMSSGFQENASMSLGFRSIVSMSSGFQENATMPLSLKSNASIVNTFGLLVQCSHSHWSKASDT